MNFSVNKQILNKAMLEVNKYLIPFLVAFLSTVFLTKFIIFLSKRINFSRRRSERHIHAPGISRLGGVVMILAFNLAIFLNHDLFLTPELYGIMFASFLILVVGIWDDFKELFWETQLFFQISLAILTFIIGVRIYFITNPITGGIISLEQGLGVIFSILLVIFWVVLLINTMNWLDGIDGLSSGVAFLSILTIFFLSLKTEVNQPPIAIMSAILAGTFLGFLIFNFNPAKVIAGTSGSVFMGFSLSILAILAGTKIATALLVMAIPIIDFFWVILERLRKKRSIFHPDQSHLHHKLLEIGWSQRKITLVYCGATALIGVVALNTRIIGKSITLFLATILMLGVYFWIDSRIKKKMIYKKIDYEK